MPGALFFGSVSFVQAKEMNAQRQRFIHLGKINYSSFLSKISIGIC
jgi:hypothetical protein